MNVTSHPVGEDQPCLPPFAVTPRAIAAIERLGGCVRIDLEVGGCCGTFYAFSLGPGGQPAERYGCEGAWLEVSPEAARVLPGARLDYGATLKPARFRVLANPNTANVCACRRSFGAPWPGPGSADCRSYQPMSWDDDYEPPDEWRRRTGWERRSR